MNDSKLKNSYVVIGWPTNIHANISLLSSFIGAILYFIVAFGFFDRSTNSFLMWYIFYPVTLFGLANSVIVLGRVFTKILVKRSQIIMSLPVVLFYGYAAYKILLILTS